MPVFEYRCTHCGHVFEHWWRGPERREELRCPQCGEKRIEKMVSLFGTKGSPASRGADCAPTGG